MHCQNPIETIPSDKARTVPFGKRMHEFMPRPRPKKIEPKSLVLNEQSENIRLTDISIFGLET